MYIMLEGGDLLLSRAKLMHERGVLAPDLLHRPPLSKSPHRYSIWSYTPELPGKHDHNCLCSLWECECIILWGCCLASLILMELCIGKYFSGIV